MINVVAALQISGILPTFEKKNMRFSTAFAIYSFLFLSTFTFGQVQIKEDDFTVTYTTNTLTVQFDNASPSHFVASDLKTAGLVTSEERMANAFVLSLLNPSQIVKIDYDIFENGQLISKTRYLATPSNSSGEISVFFNHPVDTNYSQGQNAINLSNTLDDRLISYINACQASLDIAIYNSASPSAVSGIAGAINAAYSRGVQVRVVYDGSTSSTMINLLNGGIPRIASPTASQYGIMHNKFVIFDADDVNANLPLVWTGSTNWSVSQIDGPDRNSAIVIQDQALAQVYKLEFEEMWGSNTATPNVAFSKFGFYKTDNTPHNLVIGGKVVQSYFSPTDGTNAQIIAAINSANSDIDIATMLITRSDIRNALINKFNSGFTNINLVADTQNPASNQFSTIQSALSPGHVVSYTSSGIMHHKFMVIDNFDSTSDPLVVVGSHNWSNSAETKNDENMVIVHDATVANQYYQAFAYLYQLSGGIISNLSTTDIIVPQRYKIVPNPSHGLFTFENTSIAGNVAEPYTINIFNVLGKKVWSKEYSSVDAVAIDLTAERDGMYFVEVRGNRQSQYYKLIKI